MKWLCWLAPLCLGMFWQGVQAGPTSGEALFAAHCADCHNGRVSKAPPPTLLGIMDPRSILTAMESGVMKTQAAGMSPAERRLLAEHIAGASLDAAAADLDALACEDVVFDFSQHPTLEGWGVSRDNRRYFSAMQAGVTADQMPQMKLKWVFAFPGALRARSQPSFAGGSLFVGSQDGTVYALDQETGCIRWRFSTIAEVRTGIVVADWPRGSRTAPALYFGDLVGNVYAVNAVTGELLWRDRPDDHPSLTLTAAPALYQGRLYVPLSSLEVTEAADPAYACCTFRGGVAVYDATSGRRLHTAYTIDEAPRVVGKNAVGTERIAPSGAPVWNTPTIDAGRERMYVGTGENYSSPANATSDAILALSLDDGRILWQQQMTPGDAWNMGCETEAKINCPPEDGPDYDFGAATILATTSEGRDLVLAGQKSGEVYALDPEQGGKVVWQQKLGRGGIQGGVHFGMAAAGDVLYVPMSDFDGGPRWPGKAYPGMFALDIATGEVLWYHRNADRCDGREYCDPGLSAAVTALDGGVVAGGMDGWLRVYAREDGKILWDFDTARTFEALGGIPARGGSFGGGAGPVFNDGMMYVNSGYGLYNHMPGNVLMAFGR